MIQTWSSWTVSETYRKAISVRICIVFLEAFALSSYELPALKKIATIDLHGLPGERFDYLAIDQDDKYLLSGH
jgi:hypothetical protein